VKVRAIVALKEHTELVRSRRDTRVLLLLLRLLLRMKIHLHDLLLSRLDGARRWTDIVPIRRSAADLKGDAKRKAVCKGHCVRRSGVRAAQEVQLFEVDIDCHLGECRALQRNEFKLKSF
jgi:hypothetical protein